MRPISAAASDALSGSRADKLFVNIWYDGDVVLQNLAVSKWSLGWDRSRQTQCQGSLEVADIDGKLAPWAFSDPLGVGGAQAQVVYQIGDIETVDVGWYRLTGNNPVESWRSYKIPGDGDPNSLLGPGRKLVMVSGGASINVDIDDLTVNISGDRLLAPESPQGDNPTVVGEITRLLEGIVPVTIAAGVVDEPVSKLSVWKQERLEAVEDLCSRIGCRYRMDGDGQLEVYPYHTGELLTADADWVIGAGDEGVLISTNREQSLDGLYNIFVADGQSDGNTPIRGIARETTGDLRYTGPHGRWPTFYSSDMITTQPQADAQAERMKAERNADRTAHVTVTCAPNPALQVGDVVVADMAVISGELVPLVGTVETMDLSGGQSVDQMTVGLSCTAEAVRKISRAVERGR